MMVGSCRAEELDGVHERIGHKQSRRSGGAGDSRACDGPRRRRS